MLDLLYRPRPQRKQEAVKFAEFLNRLRGQLGMNQPTMARHLGVGVRTLSHWECAYGLPPARVRLHVLMALRDLAPESAATIAEALQVPYDDKAARRLSRPSRPSARGGPSEAALRALLDPIVWRAAEAMNARPNDVRAFAVEMLGALEGSQAGLATALRAVAPKVDSKGKKKR